MTETLDPMAAEVDQKQLAEQLLAQAKEHGVELMGRTGCSINSPRMSSLWMRR